jgi:hypothetical protein
MDRQGASRQVERRSMQLLAERVLPALQEDAAARAAAE